MHPDIRHSAFLSGVGFRATIVVVISLNLYALNPTYKKLYTRPVGWGSEGVNGRSGEPEKFRRLG